MHPVWWVVIVGCTIASLFFIKVICLVCDIKVSWRTTLVNCFNCYGRKRERQLPNPINQLEKSQSTTSYVKPVTLPIDNVIYNNQPHLPSPLRK